MASITIYELSADPFSTNSVSIEAAYSADIIDDDTFLQGSDSSTQLDLSGVPNFHNSSSSFQVFETYQGEINGQAVSFVQLQFSSPIYVVVTSGQANVGDTIAVTSRPSSTPPTEYSTLPSFVCFTSGSMILTPTGRRRVESLRPGDPVIVAGGQVRPVRWIGKRRLSRQDLRRSPHLCPIRIRSDHFSTTCTNRDLVVSPQHRIAVSSPNMELLYSAPMMLAPAKNLVDGKSVRQLPPDEGVEYIHILFDQHELVNVDGIWSESLYPGDTTLSAMTAETRKELLSLFPTLRQGAKGYGPTVLPVLKPFEIRLLRHTLILNCGLENPWSKTRPAAHAA